MTKMTIAEQLDATENGEQFKTVLNNLFGFLESARDTDAKEN
jgi:hypothetical protein